MTDSTLNYFLEITKIPRESGHEEHIVEYLKNFAISHNLEYKVDEAGNVLIIKEATKGKENVPTLILQSHSDMVCEKNSGVEHDFRKDPIKSVIEDGWLIAKDTTLGADCGIGIAAQLAILADNTLEHGRLENLFTVGEETGLDGANALSSDFLTGKTLINLDSEDEGELFIGCAGGLDTTARFKYEPTASKLSQSLRFDIFGALGGHSGDDIDKNRANANRILARFLYRLMSVCDFELAAIDGGNKRNAIAREAYAIVNLNPADAEKAVKLFNEVIAEVRDEFSVSDPDVNGKCSETGHVAQVIDGKCARALIMSLNAVAHGVLEMNASIKGLVETSTNLASVKMTEDNTIRIGTSQRSATNSSRRFAAERVESAFALAGAEVTLESEYPGWKPNLNSHILEVSKASYRKLFHTEPVVRAIHAGLECGLFLNKYPDLDMISFGPTIRGVHAPGERLDLNSLDKFCKLLLDIVTNFR